MDKKHFLSLNDLSKQEINILLNRTDFLKRDKKKYLDGKTVALLFAKPSTRTRVSFEVGVTQLGGHFLDLHFDELQISRGETIEDTARVLSRYVDFIVARLFHHENLLKLARHSRVSVINALTDLLHPCQALSDMYTIKKKLRSLNGKHVVFVGDADNNVTHSLMHACSILGMEMTIACPTQYYPKAGVLVQAQRNARKSGGKIKITTNPRLAVKNADVIYTDNWVSMHKKETKKRIQALKPYQVNSKLLSHAKKNVIVMHCLAAHRSWEITDQVMDGKNSIVWDQAENRLHVQKAIMVELLG